METVTYDGGLRDSPAVDGLIASFCAQKLDAVIRQKVPIVTDKLPHARIKRIMKQDSCDPHPRMLSADTAPFMAYAAELFIGLLTTLAWKLGTQTSKRNTLQLKDLKDAVAASSKFDFIVDIIDMYDRQRRLEAEELESQERAERSAAARASTRLPPRFPANTHPVLSQAAGIPPAPAPPAPERIVLPETGPSATNMQILDDGHLHVVDNNLDDADDVLASLSQEILDALDADYDPFCTLLDEQSSDTGHAPDTESDSSSFNSRYRDQQYLDLPQKTGIIHTPYPLSDSNAIPSLDTRLPLLFMD